MKNWVKIQTFQRVHQAELRKSILEENGVHSVIINEKDSLFLLGGIELYVKSFDEAKARKLIDEFNGLSKINSFVGKKQMETHLNILTTNNINAILKHKANPKYVLDNYEIYVKNEDLQSAIPFLKEENISSWQKIKVCDSVSQTKYRTDLLDEKNIDNFIIKRKDSDYHIEQIEIYVKNEDADKSQNILDVLNGWIAIQQYDKIQFAEKTEDILNEKHIKAIINKVSDNKFELLVEANNEETAIDIINLNKEWTSIRTFKNIANAQSAKYILNTNNINAVIVNERDSSFLIGETELHVEIENKEKAEEILKENSF